LNDLEYQYEDIDSQNMNFVDLCTGWGRLIFKVALDSKLQFLTYDGIDINLPCKSRFEELATVHKLFDFKIQYLEKDLLEFDREKMYALITASWALGFFNEQQIK